MNQLILKVINLEAVNELMITKPEAQMKLLIWFVVLSGAVFSTGCTTGASALRLKDVPKENNVYFGHIEFYNGKRRIDGSSIYTRCFVGFKNEQGKTIANISMDESSWVFAAAPAGRIYLSSVLCNAGFMSVHPELHTKELYFNLTPGNPAYFGHVEIYFNYHGTAAFGMFGLVGAVANASTSSGSRDQVEIKVEDNLQDAKEEYEKRYGTEAGPVSVVEAVIKQPTPKDSTNL